MRQAIVLAWVAMGCGGGGTPPQDAEEEDRDRGVTVAEIPATPNRNLDLLFVIDDSSSMSQKQVALGASFPALFPRLASLVGGVPDIHLGVITTDMGTKFSSNAQPAPPIGTLGSGGCAERGKNGTLTVSGAPVTGNFLSDVALPDGTRQKNYDGDLAPVFAKMVSVGTGGCDFEQPLAAMRAALEGNVANAGFLRPQANLAVVFLSDEDDCSAKGAQLFAPDSAALGPLRSFRCTRFGVTCNIGGTTPDQMNQPGLKDQCNANKSSALVDDIAPYVTFLEDLKPGTRRVGAFGVLGIADRVEVELRDIAVMPRSALKSSCNFESPPGQPQSADPPVRLKAFLDQFPSRSSFATICQPDLSQALDIVGTAITRWIGTPCLDPLPLDVDPSTPGLQVDCIARDVDGPLVTKIAVCDASSAAPCWKLEQDAVACPVSPNLRLVVERDSPPSPATVTNLSCVIR